MNRKSMRNRNLYHQQAILNRKRKIFYDFLIPWNTEIEDKYWAELEKFPNCDAKLLVDRIAKPFFYEGLNRYE